MFGVISKASVIKITKDIQYKIINELGDYLLYSDIINGCHLSMSSEFRYVKRKMEKYSPLISVQTAYNLNCISFTVDTDGLYIHVIHSNTLGFGWALIECMLEYIPKKLPIVFEDASEGWWDKVVERYPEYNWVKNE